MFREDAQWMGRDDALWTACMLTSGERNAGLCDVEEVPPKYERSLNQNGQCCCGCREAVSFPC